MPDFDISSAAGEGFSIGGNMTRPAQPGDPPPFPPYPSNATGFVLTLVAERSPSDTAPIEVVGVISNGGAWTVIVPGNATLALTETENMEYSVWLKPPGSDPMLCARGRWTVSKAPGPP
jgi:hypothetical protein